MRTLLHSGAVGTTFKLSSERRWGALFLAASIAFSGCSQGPASTLSVAAAQSGAADALYNSLSRLRSSPEIMHGVDQVASGLYNLNFSQLVKTFDKASMKDAGVASQVSKLDHMLPNVGAFVTLGDSNLDPLSKTALANFATLAGSGESQAAVPAQAEAMASYIYLSAVQVLGHAKAQPASLALFGDVGDTAEEVDAASTSGVIGDDPEHGDLDDFFLNTKESTDFRIESDGSADLGDAHFEDPGNALTTAESANSVAEAAAASHLSVGQYLSKFLKNNAGKITLAVVTTAATSVTSWGITRLLNDHYKIQCQTNCAAGGK